MGEKFVVHLYIEEGTMDGEQISAGPFDTYEEAEQAAYAMRARGTANVIKLYPDSVAALAVIP